MLRKILATLAQGVMSGLIGLIWLYQKIVSPFFPARCRFYPSCSEYARQSFKRYSLLVAFWLVVKRLSKCHPLHAGGYDPVPDNPK